MKSIWKWVLGALIVLVVFSAMAFAAYGFYVSHSARVDRFERFRPQVGERLDRDEWRGPASRFDKFHNQGRGLGPGMPMLGRRGFGLLPIPFLFAGGLLRLVLPLAVLAAVGYFSYQKGRRDGMAVVPPAGTESSANEGTEKPSKRTGRKAA